MFKNILANWSNVIVSVLAVFVLYPFFLRNLGEEQYGVWLLISSATGYFSLLQMGVPMANVRFISKYYARQDYERLNEVVCTNLFFFSVGALLIFILGFGLAYLLDRVFAIPQEFVRLARFATVLVCLEISIRFVFEVFEGFFHAKQRFVAFNTVKNIMVVVRVAATYALVRYENGLILVALVLLMITVVQSIVFYCYIRASNHFLKLHYKYIKYNVFKEVFGYSMFVLLLQLGGRISFQTDALVIGSVVSVSAVVWFNIGNNLLLYFMKFISGISSAIMPKISALEANDNFNDIQDVYCKYSRLVMLLVLPVCLSFWCFGSDFIALWMGEKYRILSGTVLSILTIGYLFFLVQSGVAMPILMGTSKVKFPTILMFGSAFFNLMLSIFLGKYYGIYGVAWGTTIPLLVVVVVLIGYMCKTYCIGVRKYLSSSIFMPLIASVPFLATYFTAVSIVKINSYLVLVLCVFASFLIYSFTVYLFFLSDTEKIWCSNKLTRSAP